MAKLKEKEKAIALRKSGKSYSEIRSILGIGKGTLSVWLRDMPLSDARIRVLRDWNQRRIERYRETRRKKRDALLSQIYQEVRKEMFPLSRRELFISGLFLYWGEGGKTKPAEVTLSNNNPAIIRAFIQWLERGWRIKRSKLKIKLHLYEDMNIKNEILFWSKALNIPIKQFSRPYIKKSKFSSLNYKRGFGHGTCNAMFANAIVAKKVLMGLRALETYFNDIKG